ncbi:MAG: YerC/YecD family TrpR-related protein [Clostridiaceae bacterium]
MSKFKSKLENPDSDYLCRAILSLESKEECYRLFEDIFTINEVKSIEQRLQVAKMLKEKKTYTDIVLKTGASTATISRVNRCVHYGSDGYNIVFDRLFKEDEK